MTRWLMYLDLMHLADCRGFSALVFGGVLGLMMVSRGLGANRDMRLRFINAAMRTWYQEHPGTHRLPRIKAGNLTLDGWHELHGPNVKAANTRAAAPLFTALARRFLPGDTPTETSARALTAYLQEFYEIIYSQAMFMQPDAIEPIRFVCEEMGYHYQALREYSRQNSVLAFNAKPKADKISMYQCCAR